MDQGTLVSMQIEDGQRLLARLVEGGVPVTAAAWVKEEESGMWYLYLATPLVGEDTGTLPAYRRVNAVIRALPEPLGVGPFEIKVVAPSSPIGKALRDLQRRAHGSSPYYYRGTRLGDLSIEGAYVYPPVPAPVQ
jgi:hypothetical protein